MRNASFKQYQRQKRAVTIEETFNRGMYYTNTPLAEGQYKMLTNYDFKDDGRILIPRAGFQPMQDSMYAVTQNLQPYTCLQVGQAKLTDKRETINGVPNPDYDTEELRKFIIFSKSVNRAAIDVNIFSDEIVIMLDSAVTSETPDLFQCPMQAIERFAFIANNFTNKAFLHNMLVTQSEPKLVTTSLNAEQYYLTSKGIAKLSFENQQDAGIRAVFTMIEPKVLTPHEAMNYGYNMLLDSPYQFSDRYSAAFISGTLSMQGLLPYADETYSELLFNAKTGTPITFRLYADFPLTTAKYTFKWEVRELGSDSITVFEEQTKVYTSDGTRITDPDGTEGVHLTIQPPYERFSVTVTAYSAETGADETEPIGVILLAAYHLVGDSIDALNQIEVKNYNLTTATGMTSWGQRIVLWGANSARTTLFISDVNNANWFPYPNMADIFTENIVACIPFLSDLLVFTESKLYLVVWDPTGLAYTKTVVQENLVMSPFDVTTITTVKNMVYFKNGNYYYMVVPSTKVNTMGELVLAPISTPITNLLDDFADSVLELVDELYNPERFNWLLLDRKFTLKLNDFVNYLDGNFIRNVYNMTLCDDLGTQFLTFDFILNYNSVLRTWSTFIIQCNQGLVRPYLQTVTDKTLYVSTVNQVGDIPDPDYVEDPDDPDPEPIPMVQGYQIYCELFQANIYSCEDTFTIDNNERQFQNWQYIDTGYREHDSSTKKRYREMQFKINNVEETSLEFGMGFLIDDDTRRGLYTYTPEWFTTDPASELFGWIIMNRDFAEPALATGATILEDDPIAELPFPSVITKRGDWLASNRWVLDISKLSTAVTFKIRVPVSGKGYSPRLKLISYNQKRYELLNINWVYRIMNSR